MFLIRLIFLPLTLLRSALGLVGLTTGIGFFFLRLIVRNMLLIIILIVGLLIYNAFKSEPDQLRQLQPAPATQKAPKGAPPVIQPVTKREDGDSVFATDLYALMNEQERLQYSGAYYTAIGTIPDGQAHAWSFHNIHGSITPTLTFTNRVGETCREFREVLKVQHIQQTLTGTACPTGQGGWCKLKPNATPGCGLGGHKPGIFDGISNSLMNLF
jgi:surface antigen